MRRFGRYEIINWYPEWDFGFWRTWQRPTYLAPIEWRLDIGYWEIRRRGLGW